MKLDLDTKLHCDDGSSVAFANVVIDQRRRPVTVHRRHRTAS